MLVKRLDPPSLLKLISNLDIYASAVATFKIKPDRLGHFVCLFNAKHSWKVKTRFKKNAFEYGATINPQLINDELVGYSIRTMSKTVDIKFSKSLYESIIKDPEFAINCAFLTLAMPVASLVDYLDDGELTEITRAIMLGKYRHTIDPMHYEVPIPPTQIGKTGVGSFD